ncbi:hypothetical protein Hanom_Chr11g00980821 [Helianthus anomalus]
MKTIMLSVATALLCCNSEARLHLGDKLTGASGRDMIINRGLLQGTYWPTNRGCKMCRLLTDQNDNFGARGDNTRGKVTDDSSGFTTFVFTGSKNSSRKGFRFESCGDLSLFPFFTNRVLELFLPFGV